jgi:hypothetical protein
MSLAAATHRLDERRSPRPFFEKVQRESGGRALWTSILDDRDLPMMNFYLERRFDSTADVAVILRASEYVKIRPDLPAAAGIESFSSGGNEPLVFLANHPQWECAISGLQQGPSQ